MVSWKNAIHSIRDSPPLLGMVTLSRVAATIHDDKRYGDASRV